jgi:hypothetical protein
MKAALKRPDNGEKHLEKSQGSGRSDWEVEETGPESLVMSHFATGRC